MSVLSSKIKTIKDSDKSGPNIVRCGPVQEDDKSYNSGSNYDVIATVKLPKGKHILTISFLVKATNSWMYLYFQQGQQCIQNCGFYVPTNSQFIPFTIRKLYTVNSAEENVTFNTYCAQSYPVTLRDVILTAQEVV